MSFSDEWCKTRRGPNRKSDNGLSIIVDLWLPWEWASASILHQLIVLNKILVLKWFSKYNSRGWTKHIYVLRSRITMKKKTTLVWHISLHRRGMLQNILILMPFLPNLFKLLPNTELYQYVLFLRGMDAMKISHITDFFY